MTAIFSFWGWAYNDGTSLPTWSTAPKVNDANFGDDVIPVNTDPIMGYGSLGFGAPGTTPCPTSGSDQDGTCCDPAGACTVTTEAACLSPAIWTSAWTSCAPNPCPQPPSACCTPAGTCTVTMEGDCVTPNVWHSTRPTCVPGPCLASAGGSIVAWGSNYHGQCTVPVPNADFVAITAGGVHSLGLKSDRPILGACCSSAGTCTLALQAACQSSSVWQGAATFCRPDPCPPTPVLIESWTASSLTEGLQIRWEMPLGMTGARFRAWRDPAAGRQDLAPTPDAVLVSSLWMSASAEGIIEIIDRDAPRGATIRYFLKMATTGARNVFLGPVEARWDPPALVWSVGPTPFRDAVRLVPPAPGQARVEIFDPAGRLVRILVRIDGGAPLEWDGTDGTGRETPTGVYLVRLTSASGDAVKRLVKIQ